MSFILDALRKSESERQRSAVPSVTRVPPAIPRADLPAWAIAMILVLTVSVLAFGGAWWRSLQAPPAAPDLTTGETPTVASAPGSAASPPAPERSAGSTLENLTARTPLAPAAGSAAAEPPRDDATTRAAPRTPVAEASLLPTAADFAADGVVLPELRLELHGYDPQPSQRFVFINGRRYAEGETLREGPRLIAISADAAILSYGGAEFRLPSQ